MTDDAAAPAWKRMLAEVESWCASNAFLIATVLLLIICAWGLSRIEEHVPATRDQRSIIVLGVGFPSSPTSRPHFSLKQDESEHWRVVIVGNAEWGARPKFSISKSPRIGTCIAIVNSDTLFDSINSKVEEQNERFESLDFIDGRSIGGRIEDIQFQIPRSDPVGLSAKSTVSYSVSCPILVGPMKDGATERSIQVQAVGAQHSTAGVNDSDTNVDFDSSSFINRQWVQIVGGTKSGTESIRTISGADVITIHWRSDDDAFRRDVSILALGALLGAAAACFIEWLRPILESWSARKKEKSAR
jgi:hypothetical protein